MNNNESLQENENNLNSSIIRKISKNSVKCIFSALEEGESIKKSILNSAKQYKSGGKKYDLIKTRKSHMKIKTTIPSENYLFEFFNKTLNRNMRTSIQIGSLLLNEQIKPQAEQSKKATKLPIFKKINLTKNTNINKLIEEMKETNDDFAYINNNCIDVVNKETNKIQEKIESIQQSNKNNIDYLNKSKFNFLSDVTRALEGDLTISQKELNIALEQRKRKFGNVKETALMNGILSKLVKPLKERDLIRINKNKLKFNYKPDIKQSRVNKSLSYLEVPKEYKSQNNSNISIIDTISKQNTNFNQLYQLKQLIMIRNLNFYKFIFFLILNYY